MSQAVLSRRRMLSRTAAAGLASFCIPGFALAGKTKPRGSLVGETGASAAAETIFAAGGNAFDAIVAAAFAAGISNPSNCGIGGYGGCAMIGLAKTRKVYCIDFNAVAPLAARPDMYELNERGLAKDRKNALGWLAVGVPGVPAGLELVQKKFGTKSLREVLQPAIAMAGKARQNRFVKFPELRACLETFAKRDSCESFYRGDIAGIIADAFQKHGGLVTKDDLERFHPREQEPLSVEWRGATIHGAPLPSGSPTVLQAIQLLKAYAWHKQKSGPASTYARVEMLRLLWSDRLEYYGDPKFVDVPMDRLLSETHAAEQAQRVRQAVKEQKPITLQVRFLEQKGTVNLSSVDEEGNVAALTLTHGSSYGAQVVVDQLGMVLGHGMWRFDPQPGHPNSIAPGKRPLHNMTPCIIVRDGRPVLAIGGAGGTRIENAIIDFMAHHIGRNASVEEALKKPRLNCFGLMDVGLERNWPKDEEAYLEKLGYKTHFQIGAVIGAAEHDYKRKDFAAHLRLGDPAPRLNQEGATSAGTNAASPATGLQEH
jgi:gamma-glutamyltranspeptidase/glutathione hydrolase